MRTARAVLDVAIIALVADFIWQMARVSIDDYFDKKAPGDQAASDDEARRRQRLHTLLPVLRHALLVTVAGVAGLTALSTLGVAVGPLIGGAGVAGIAIGFGAQTLVKDIISGLLFLFDYAFRIGETIESGSMNGKVESCSLRSVKLRHDKGACTRCRSALSTITNFSRDWVIDRFLISVTYDTDLDTVGRIITDVGYTLREDPRS